MGLWRSVGALHETRNAFVIKGGQSGKLNKSNFTKEVSTGGAKARRDVGKPPNVPARNVF